jgi:hypothetical protein
VNNNIKKHHRKRPRKVYSKILNLSQCTREKLKTSDHTVLAKDKTKMESFVKETSTLEPSMGCIRSHCLMVLKAFVNSGMTVRLNKSRNQVEKKDIGKTS